MQKNKALFDRAKNYYIGGVDAANRFHTVLGAPLYLERVQGSRLYDVDGKAYLDFHTSAGAALFGYGHPRLMEAARQALDRGAVMNFDTEDHLRLAQLMGRMIPCAQRIRLGNTGTEVTQAAIRLARGYTGRDLCVRMEGHFHGMHELIWYNHNAKADMAGDGEVATLPDTAGVPKCFRDVVKNVPFNDIAVLERICEKYRGQIACIIMEPVSFNCGCYPARKSYLEQVRALCDREGIVLIFDEVICGLRMRPGTAQGYYGVTPDLATFAKAIGGTFPIAALCGKKEIMECLAPAGKVGMSGTYTGSLMAVLAAIQCFEMALEPDFYDSIEGKAEQLYGGINQLFQRHGVKGHCRGMGARFGMYFGVEDPETDLDWRQVCEAYDVERNRRFVGMALEEGLYFVDPGRDLRPVTADLASSTPRRTWRWRWKKWTGFLPGSNRFWRCAAPPPGTGAGLSVFYHRRDRPGGPGGAADPAHSAHILSNSLKNSAAVFQAGKASQRVPHAVFDDEIQTKAAKAACPG